MILISVIPSNCHMGTSQHQGPDVTRKNGQGWEETVCICIFLLCEWLKQGINCVICKKYLQDLEAGMVSLASCPKNTPKTCILEPWHTANHSFSQQQSHRAPVLQPSKSIQECYKGETSPGNGNNNSKSQTFSFRSPPTLLNKTQNLETPSML